MYAPIGWDPLNRGHRNCESDQPPKGADGCPAIRRSPTSSLARSRSRQSTTRSLRCKTGRLFTPTTWGARPRTGDPQDRRHEHLRLGPAHGPRAHDRACWADLGHEITGEVIEASPGVEFIKEG